MKNIRRLAAEALMKLDSRDAWSNLALDAQMRKYGLDARDGAFFAALFYGVLERRITLDACISAHSKTALDKLSPQVREVLRMGIYQLLYMDSVPDHAAVAESVELIKKLRKAQATGFVNGVLRSFLRAGKTVALPEGPPAERLGVEYSCPAAIVRLWIDSYGEEAARRILCASLGRAPLFIRVNTLKITKSELISRLARHGVAAVADPELENCLTLEKAGSVSDLPEYKRGFFHVQDKASQLCAAALEAGENDRVLDVCSAPGGKAFTAAQLMNGTGEITACDMNEKRVALIGRGAKRLGIKSIKVKVRDGTVYDPDLGVFDKILCDVPCSGLGAMRRKPEIKLKDLESLSNLPELQYKILENASQYCKSGGRIVYSTCTLNPAENEAVADRFLAEHGDFAPALLPGYIGRGHKRTFLGETDADGFFIAVMEKRR